jgi:lycopene cyclase domain-containing protein
VNLAVLAGPFALSFDRKVAFYRHWRKLAFSLLVVSTAYLAWDVIVTEIGHWWFNPEYSGAFRVAGLPPGEVLFFITVPYACIFIYEVVRAYFPERRSTRSLPARAVAVAAAIVLLVFAFVFRDGGYSPLALLSVAVMLLLTAAADPEMWMSSHTALFFLLAYIPFFIANGVLTALPIVGYSPDAIWGVRVTTIPLEDFFYNLGMLGFYLFFYRLAGRLFEKKDRVA